MREGWVRRALKVVAAAMAAGFTAPNLAAQSLAWDPSAGATGYSLHVGYSSRTYEYAVDAGASTSLPLPPLAAGRTHYFAVSAYDDSGRRSGFSNEVVFSAADAERVALNASFTASPVSGTAPLSVRFTPTASGAISWYRFDFGDGSGGLTQSALPMSPIAHVYHLGGSYPITFTVSGPAGQRTVHGAAPIQVQGAGGGGGDGCPCSMWESGVPAVEDDGSTEPVTVGMRFAATRDGHVTAIRFYRGPANAGPHLGQLWTETGGHLGAVAFDESAPPGWQEARFPVPVPVVAGEHYVATYHAPHGHVARSNGTFLKDVANGPLVAPAHRTSAPNGVFARGAVPMFPRLADKQTNFWVDVVFVPSSATSDSSAQPASPRLVH
jgi:PKD repeat protein